MKDRRCPSFFWAKSLLCKVSLLLLPCRGLQPLDLQQLLFAKGDLYFVLVNPKFEAPTAEMRAVLPKMVPMTSAIHNSSMGGSLVSPKAHTESFAGLLNTLRETPHG